MSERSNKGSALGSEGMDDDIWLIADSRFVFVNVYGDAILAILRGLVRLIVYIDILNIYFFLIHRLTYNIT